MCVNERDWLSCVFSSIFLDKSEVYESTWSIEAPLILSQFRPKKTFSSLNLVFGSLKYFESHFGFWVTLAFEALWALDSFWILNHFGSWVILALKSFWFFSHFSSWVILSPSSSSFFMLLNLPLFCPSVSWFWSKILMLWMCWAEIPSRAFSQIMSGWESTATTTSTVKSEPDFHYPLDLTCNVPQSVAIRQAPGNPTQIPTSQMINGSLTSSPTSSSSSLEQEEENMGYHPSGTISQLSIFRRQANNPLQVNKIRYYRCGISPKSNFQLRSKLYGFM